jgi:uncharacterized protein GlcG (DUF336 family)
LPIVIDGKVVGAIGVSGMAANQDAQVKTVVDCQSRSTATRAAIHA